MSSKLPELCSACRKLKVAELGSFSPIRSRYNAKRWTCFACQEKQSSTPVRQGRWAHPPTPIELEAVRALSSLKVKSVQEFKIHGLPFFYDFAVPSLRLIVEVDGMSYHRHRRKRDKAKQEAAERLGWSVARVEGPEVGLKVQLAVERRLSEIG